jgi:hypothetical protein
MRKTQRRYKKREYKKRTTLKGGDCGCGKMKWSGGYGQPSYQGGLDNYITPFNTNITSDPNSPGNMVSERFFPFVGGKRRNRSKKISKGGNRLSIDPMSDMALGRSVSTNPVLGFGTTGGMMSASRTLMGR